MKTVYVNFASGYNQAKTYHYIYDLKEPVNKGDYVIVDTPNSGITAVKVIDIQDGLAGNATKYVVDRVDMTDYLDRKAKSEEKIRLTAALELMAAKQNEKYKYAWLSSVSEDAAKIIKRLEEIS